MKNRFLAISLFLLQIATMSALEFKNLGPNINTDKDEFLPVVYNDTLYFRRSLNNKSSDFVILKIACKDVIYGDSSAKPVVIYKIGDYTNTAPSHDFKESTKPPVAFDPSTGSFYNFSGDKLSKYKLDTAKRINVSTDFTDMHPALAPDGSFIVFSSDRPKKAGEQKAEPDLDLWITYRQNDNSWSKPANLGKTINTPQNEISPFIAPDGTLYYSSKGFIRDSVNIVFSGQAKANPSTKSDLFIITEKPNYNIVKAEPTGNKKSPFANPQLLPPPFNTEFNEIGPTVWNDTLIFLASDRLKPYDRPDPLNQEGFDLYGFMETNPNPQPPPAFLFTDSVPFFVTGYYYPNTPDGLTDLKRKIGDGILRNSNQTKFIADPDNETDENGKRINYKIYAPAVAEQLNKAKDFIDTWLDWLSKKGSGKIKVEMLGFADQRALADGSAYTEGTVRDKDFNFYAVEGQPLDNEILAKIRALFTGRILKKLVASHPDFDRLSGSIQWKVEGRVDDVFNRPNSEKRRVAIKIEYLP